MAASSAFISFPVLLYEGWVLLASVDGLFPTPPPPPVVSLVEVTLATSGAGFVLVASPRREPSFC